MQNNSSIIFISDRSWSKPISAARIIIKSIGVHPRAIIGSPYNDTKAVICVYGNFTRFDVSLRIIPALHLRK